MKVLITGATGFLGGVLTERLINRGFKTRILVRNSNRLSDFIKNNSEIFEGDIVKVSDVDKAVNGVEKIFHIAAVYRTAGITDQVYKNVHVNGTENLLNASLKFKVKHFIHCSTIGVHGHIENPPADENYKFNPGDIYQITKLEGEKKSLEFYKIHGLPVTIIRPAAIYGPRDTRLLKLFQIASKNPKIILGDGKIFYHLAYVEDLADAFILASETDKAIGETFIIANNEIPTLNELVLKISNIIEKPGKIIHFPVLPFQIAGSLCEKVCIPLGINPPIYRRRVDFFTKSRSFDISKAKRILSYSPKVSLEEGLKKTAEWYIKENLL